MTKRAIKRPLHEGEASADFGGYRQGHAGRSLLDRRGADRG